MTDEQVHPRPRRHRVQPIRTERARELRQQASTPERLMWGGRRLDGIKFRRQHPIGPYVADFYCAAAKLVIELDGDSHIGRADADERRQRFIEDQGFMVIRFSNEDVLRTPDAVAETIWREVERLKQADAAPSPRPSPSEGEGV